MQLPSKTGHRPGSRSTLTCVWQPQQVSGLLSYLSDQCVNWIRVQFCQFGLNVLNVASHCKESRTLKNEGGNPNLSLLLSAQQKQCTKGKTWLRFCDFDLQNSCTTTKLLHTDVTASWLDDAQCYLCNLWWEGRKITDKVTTEWPLSDFQLLFRNRVCNQFICLTASYL